jgi:hypothetical protein
LDILKESAEAEENTGFDASGSGGVGLLPEDDVEARRGNGSASGSSKSPPAWSSYTDDTSLSQALSSLDLEGNECSRTGEDTHNEDELAYSGGGLDLDDDAKESLLCRMFPTLKPFDIKWALKKHKGDLNHVIDELMTQSFLDETGGRRYTVATKRKRKEEEDSTDKPSC